MSQTTNYDVVVAAASTVIRVTNGPIEGATPGYLLFAGYLETTDVPAVGIGGKIVTLFIDGQPQYSFVTSATGFWNFDGVYLQPFDHTYQLKVVWGGDADYDPCETQLYSFAPSKIPTEMYVTATPPATVDPGVQFNFGGNLREIGAAGVPNKAVDLYIGGAVQDTVTTGAAGEWNFPITLAGGTFSMYAKFAGDVTYEGCEKRLSTRKPLLAAAGVLAGLVGIACLKR